MTARRPGTGSATAELALALPAVVLVLATVLGVGQVALAQVACLDGARAAARAAARGDSPARAVGVAQSLAPPGATVTMSRGGGLIRVEVRDLVAVAVPGLPPVAVHGSATAAQEDSAPPQEPAP